MSGTINLWVTDTNGNEIKGGSKIQGRAGSSDVYSLDQFIATPFDADTGRVTAVRKHSPLTILKGLDSMSPLLNKACSNGETLKQVMVKVYGVDHEGQEKETYRYTLSNAKVVSTFPLINRDSHQSNQEQVSFTFDKIEWTHLDGNIETADEWIKRS